jgi:gag-polypeptide of LTR copia-type
MSSSESSLKFKHLNNLNYIEWSGNMKAWLMKLGYWRLVCGKEPKPSEAASLDKWEIKAEKAAAEIYLAVENDQRAHIRGMEEDPIGMWKKLSTIHLQQKPGARFNAYDDLFTIRKKEDESLLDLGVRIDQAMGTIQNLRPKDFTIDKLDEELQCMALIRALPEEYAHLTATLLLMDTLDKDKVVQAFRSEELNRQRKVKEEVNRARTFKPRKFFKGVYCNGCEKEGHIVAYCPDRRNNRENRGGNQAKRAEGGETSQSKVETVTESAGNASICFDAFATSSNEYNWNTDTGATSHMTPH